VSTGDSFSPENGLSGPVPSSSTIRNNALANAARSSPASAAIFGADCAVTAGLSFPSGHIVACSFAFSSGVTRRPPARASASSIASCTASTTTTLFSDEHDVALSNAFERAISAAA
jgi:hypothetical protein